MVNFKISTLLSINRRLISTNMPFYMSPRCINSVALVSNEQCKRNSDITSMMFKRNAVSWPNLLEKIKTKSRLKLSGSLLYEVIADQVNYNKFFQDFNMEDTFFSWFLITEVHVWMIALRVMQEEHGQELRNNLIEAMWNDVKIRTKKLGIINSSLMNQQLEELYEQFNASLIGYDEAILSKDTILVNHIWKRFFNSKNNDPTQLEQLVKYIRKQVHILSKTPTTNIISLSPSVSWINLSKGY